MNAEPKLTILTLDHERVETMITPVLKIISAELKKGPPDRTKVFEALNALAIITATVLNATADEEGVDENAGEFFRHALNTHLIGAPEHKAGEELWFIPGQKSN